METITGFLIEQELVIVRFGNNKQRVTLKISAPRLVTETDEKVWECTLKLDGLVDIDKPVRGMSSLDAVVVALRCARIFLKQETSGAKIYLVDNIRNVGSLYPEDGVSVDEIFE